ncbi:hypothetical protein ZWY2020_026362 [Hordeum vulgare]|nr:hypothetical protein ZWY2020_026362 [Hordeum vulgare]
MHTTSAANPRAAGDGRDGLKHQRRSRTRPRHPANPCAVPDGSSSCSAVAAASLADFALGTNTARRGARRICGIFASAPPTEWSPPRTSSPWRRCSTLSNSVWLDLGRLSIGCGIGILSYVVPVYISEITPKNLRGRFAAVNQLMICCGASLAYALGTCITWRALEEALQKLRGKETNVLEEAADIKDFTEKLQHLPQSKMLDLFQKDYIHAVTVGVGLMVLQQFGGVNTICFYASEIFVSACFSSGNTGMLAMVAVQIPMTALGVLLMDKAGRRPLLMIINHFFGWKE